MISFTDKQNHTEQKAPGPDLVSASLGDLPSTPLKGKGKKQPPPDSTTRICVSLGTSKPPQAIAVQYRDIFRSTDYFYITRKSWAQSNQFKKHRRFCVTWLAYILLPSQSIYSKSPYSVAPDKQAILPFLVGYSAYFSTWTEPCTSASLTSEKEHAF